MAGCADKHPQDNTDLRIVSLAPSLTEIICAIGGEENLVGRTSACDYPESIIDRVPVIGAFGKPSLESLVAARPTLVLDAALADETVGRKIESLGIQRERIDCREINDIPIAIRRVGALTGLENNAEALASRIEGELKILRESALSRTARPKVYIETWNDPVWTVGANTAISEMVSLAGGINIGDTVDKEHFQASQEWIVSHNPDIIFCLYMSSKAPAKEALIKRPGWQAVNAIKNNKVYDGFENDIMLRPGPRIIEGIMEFKRYIDDIR
ncbi:hypothetical protein BVX97_06270 [bacterium E08(2017)]|nr:hypothetical protein BVX97_06270 [bacterium E08(2017)]